MLAQSCIFKNGEYTDCEFSADSELCITMYFDFGKLIWVKIYLDGVLVEEQKQPSSVKTHYFFSDYGMTHLLYYNEVGDLEREIRTFGDSMDYEKVIIYSVKGEDDTLYNSYLGYKETYTFYNYSEIKTLEKKYDKDGKLVYDESGLNGDEKGNSLEISNYITSDTIVQNFFEEMTKSKNEKTQIMKTYIKNVSFNTMPDSRDGNTYKTVTIGDQTWMAENLAFEPEKGRFHNYRDDSSKLIYLYDWKTALEVCPTGWHLPNNSEWKELSEMLGGDEFSGVKMKSKTGWRENKNGNNLSGFNAFPIGYSFTKFKNNGGHSIWWSKDQDYLNDHRYDEFLYAKSPKLYWSHEKFNISFSTQKSEMLSVRCIKD